MRACASTPRSCASAASSRPSCSPAGWTELHSLHDFLVERCGVHRRELAAIRARAIAPDLVAFNHYPHSERYLFGAPDGTVGDVPAVYVEGQPAPQAGPLLRAAAERLRLPLALGEVHVHAPAAERVRWLAQHASDVRALRASGADVRAIGAWAAFGMTDWHSLLRDEDGVREDGVFSFAAVGETPRRTALADAVESLARSGRIEDDGTRGWWERDDRYLPLSEMLAMRDRGEPEGDHLLIARVRLGSIRLESMPFDLSVLEELLLTHHHQPAVAERLRALMAEPAFVGVVSAAEAAALAQQQGITVPQLALQLVPYAQAYAVVPISKYKVGAVALGLSGALYYGANLEVAGQALSFSVHAEQSATANAWVNGETGLQTIAISAAPCGYCRQFLYELVTAATLTISLPNTAPTLLTTLLPDAFGPHDLGVQGGLMQAQSNGLQLPGGADPAGQAALAAANASYSPYTSTFAGVALQTGDGAIFTGRYAENAAYNPSMSPLEGALSALVLNGRTFGQITEAVLVEVPGAASQAGVTGLLLSSVTAVPLTSLTAVKG